MPRETSGFVLVIGAMVGLLWGIFSLQFGWDTNVWPVAVLFAVARMRGA